MIGEPLLVGRCDDRFADFVAHGYLGRGRPSLLLYAVSVGAAKTPGVLAVGPVVRPAVGWPSVAEGGSSGLDIRLSSRPQPVPRASRLRSSAAGRVPSLVRTGLLDG